VGSVGDCWEGRVEEESSGVQDCSRRRQPVRVVVAGKPSGDSTMPGTAAIREGSFPVVCWEMEAVKADGKAG